MADQSIISRHQASVGTGAAVVIDFGTGVQKVYVNTLTADVNIEFNGTANADSFRVIATQPAATVFEFPGSSVHTVSLLGNGGTANVYVLGVVT